MRLSRAVALVCPVVLLSGLITGAPASAAPAPDYEAPFPCGSEWVGTTRSSHAPSYHSVDFNRPDDLGAFTVATAPGVVTRVADTGSTSYGKYVIVDHGDGDSSLYAHMLSQAVVTGQRIDQGEILGQVGSSGGSTGAHLHFEERLAGSVVKPYFHQAAYTFGTTLTSQNCPDVPIAGNWNGKGADEVGVFRRGASNGVFRLWRPMKKPLRFQLGYGTDTPVTGDWDGNGRTDVGVRTTGSNKFTLRLRNGSTTTTSFGRRTDVPVTADWNGDGTTELGVWRPANARFRMRIAPGDVRVTRLGSPGSLPLTGDWNGDGVGDIGVYDATTRMFTLRTRPIGAAATTVTFGASADLPVTADWNNDGRTDLGTWSPGTAQFSMRVLTSPNASSATVATRKFGLARVRY